MHIKKITIKKADLCGDLWDISPELAEAAGCERSKKEELFSIIFG